MMRCELTATTPPTIKTMATTEISGRSLTYFCTTLPNSELTRMPPTIGTMTTLTIDIIIAEREMSTQAPASHQVKSGVTTGARIVVVIVIETDSATSPRARYVMTFDDVPPGQVPTRMTPAASSGGRPKPLASSHARPGMIVNWARAPTKTSFGRWKTRRKSRRRSVVPMPNMTMPSSSAMFGAAHLNVHGWNRAIAATRMTKTAMYFDMKLLSFSKNCISSSPFKHFVYRYEFLIDCLQSYNRNP